MPREAIDMDIALGSKAVTDEDAPPFGLVIGQEIVIEGRVVRHPKERRFEEAIPLLREASHIEVVASEP